MTPIFPETNTRQEVPESGGDDSIFLLDREAAWIVAAGRVDLFLVSLGHSQTPGPRSHVARIESGEMFFGMDPAALPDGWTFFVQTDPGTRLRRVDRDTVSLSSLEAWVGLLAAVITRGLVEPKQYQPVAPGNTVEIPPDALPLTGRDHMVWVRHLRGEGRFLGNSKLPPVSGESYFPLAPPAWLEEKPGNLVAVASTAGALSEDTGRAGLDLYHRVVCQALVFAREAAEAEERTRLEARKSEDDARLDTSLRQLTAPLVRAGEKMAGSGSHDPLLNACQAIGALQGIIFRPTPEMIRHLPMRDPVGSLWRSSGARCRRVVLDGNWYRREGQPLLAFRESDQRPVALLPRRSSGYYVYDPAVLDPRPASQTKVGQELADSLQPFAYCFYRGFPPTRIRLTDLCLFGLKGSWRDLVLILLCGLVAGLMGLVFPVITRNVFDVIIPGGQRNRLVEVSLFVLAASLSAAMISLTRGFALLRVENQVDAKVEAAVWSRLLSLPVSFFRQYSTGDLALRAMGISTIRQMLTSSAMTAIFTGLFSVGNFALLFYYNIPLALLATVLTVVELATFLGFAGYQLKVQRAGVDVQGRLSGMLLQLIGNISKFRVSGAENRAFIAWSRIFLAYRKRALLSAKTSNWLAVFARAFSIVSSMAIFWMTSKIVTASKGSAFTTGDFMAFVAAYGSFSGALMSMGQVVVGLLAIVPLYQRCKPILDAVPESDPTQQIAGELAGRIEIRHVSFRYRNGGPLVLNDVSLSIAPGEFIAIVGPSGSGKSTLVRLLLGFEKPASGTIAFDGQDMTSFDISSLRQQMGVVLQNSTVFSGDVYSNITSSAPYGLDEAWEAVRIAGLEEDLRAMPMGMHTVLGEGGVGLSGGQRQRLMIARAVAGKPRVLLFDEATSALDNQTQEKVSGNLEQLRSTRVVIAHRLSTVMNADRIFVIEHGSLVQSGKYEELLTQPGPFAELAKRQLT